MSLNNFHRILKDNFSHLNLSELARELRIPRTVLHDWIMEKRSPSFKNLNYIKRIAQYLNCTLDELFDSEIQISKTLSSITFEDQGRKYIVQIHRVK